MVEERKDTGLGGLIADALCQPLDLQTLLQRLALIGGVVPSVPVAAIVAVTSVIRGISLAVTGDGALLPGAICATALLHVAKGSASRGLERVALLLGRLLARLKLLDRLHLH